MKNKVFISYASADYRYSDGEKKGEIIPNNVIMQIIKVLDDNKIDRWIDESGLLSAKGWCQQIRDAINECNIFLFVATEKSNASDNTANEIYHALEQKKHIIPFKVDQTPYHKDISLSIKRIQFIKYYENRNKSFRDLVSTIKGITTDIVVSYVPVSFRSGVVATGDVANMILGTFQASDLQTASKNFKSLLDTFPCSNEEGYSSLKKYIDSLSRTANENNYEVRRNMLILIIAQLRNEGKLKSKRHVKLMFILFEMYLYYAINDLPCVRKIQQGIKDTNYELSYIEKKADTINETANGITRAGLFIGGLVATFMGHGSGKIMAVSATKGEKINIVKTSGEIQRCVDSFENLKKLAMNLVFDQQI